MHLRALSLWLVTSLSPLEAEARLPSGELNQIHIQDNREINQRVYYILHSLCWPNDDWVIMYNPNSKKFEICDFHTLPHHLAWRFPIASEKLNMWNCWLYLHNDILCTMRNQVMNICFVFRLRWEPVFPGIIPASCQEVRRKWYRWNRN